MKTLKICKECSEKKKLIEFGPHVTTYDKLNQNCKQCVSKYNKAYREKNKEKVKQYALEYAAKHREPACIRAAEWRENNKERSLDNNRRLYAANKEKYSKQNRARYIKNKEANKARAKQWKIDNRDKVLAQNAKRRADKKNATPSWADLDKIQTFYTESVRLSKETGIPHQVDHIIPLNGKEVSGLHVETNLRVITAEENNAKKNKLIENLL